MSVFLPRSTTLGICLGILAGILFLLFLVEGARSVCDRHLCTQCACRHPPLRSGKDACPYVDRPPSAWRLFLVPVLGHPRPDPAVEAALASALAAVRTAQAQTTLTTHIIDKGVITIRPTGTQPRTRLTTEEIEQWRQTAERPLPVHIPRVRSQPPVPAECSGCSLCDGPSPTPTCVPTVPSPKCVPSGSSGSPGSSGSSGSPGSSGSSGASDPSAPSSPSAPSGSSDSGNASPSGDSGDSGESGESGDTGSSSDSDDISAPFWAAFLPEIVLGPRPSFESGTTIDTDFTVMTPTEAVIGHTPHDEIRGRVRWLVRYWFNLAVATSSYAPRQIQLLLQLQRQRPAIDPLEVGGIPLPAPVVHREGSIRAGRRGLGRWTTRGTI